MKPPDVRLEWLKFAQRLPLACDEHVGNVKLRPRPQLEVEEWPKAVAALVHSMKTGLLMNGVFDTAVPKDRILRGVIDKDERDSFWVVTTQDLEEQRAQGSALLPQQTGEPDTLKQHAAWICALDKLKEVINMYATEPSGSGGVNDSDQLFCRVWREGFLHVLRSAPRTRWGRLRIRLGTKAEFAGPAVMLICGYIGDYDNMYSTLRKVVLNFQDSGTWPCRPFFEMLSLKMPTTLRPTVLSAILSSANIDRLPRVVREELDDEQLDVLDKIAKSQNTLHFLEALAGTGKSRLGRAVVLSFVLNGPQDRVLAYVTATRDLRDDVALSITEGVAEVGAGQQGQAAEGPRGPLQ